jgi:hypothetical protein
VPGVAVTVKKIAVAESGPLVPKAVIIVWRIPRLIGCRRADGLLRPGVTAPAADESLGERANRLWGFIDEVRADGLLAQVRLRVRDSGAYRSDHADAFRTLKLRRGENARAIIKSTEVMTADLKRQTPTICSLGKIRTNRRDCSKRWYRTRSSTAEVFQSLTLSRSICLSKGTKPKAGWEAGIRTRSRPVF